MSSILLFLILLILSGFFSGSETAFFSLGKVQLEKFKKRNRKALRIERLRARPDYLIASILIGNMFVNIAFSSLITKIFVGFDSEIGLFLSISISSLLIMIFGEILPKGIAISVAEKFALFSSYIINTFSRIVYPVSFVIISISRGIFRVFFRRELKEEDLLTEEELKEALELGRSEGVIDEEEQDMIHSILEFSEVEVSEIMTPRVNMKAIDIQDAHEDIREKLRKIRHSYVPVYQESIDNIVGVLKTKDYFLSQEKEVEKIMRIPFFVPETKNISDLLKEMMEKKEKMAVVMDEYGGVAGIVTLEDVQEEIFGELYDEYEIPLPDIEELKGNEYRVNPSTPVKDFNYELDVNIPEEEDTIGGFVLSLIERFPLPGEKITYENIDFVVEKSTRKRILLLKVKVKK